ncbi:MAG: hypothetical protein JWN50_684 [Parcubacteria group bacterium]|nr:hypothetical protein [Parcubacteria group bacterium]
MKYQKGYSVLLTVLVIAVIVVAAGGYIYYKTTPTPDTQDIVQAVMPAIDEQGTSPAAKAVEVKVTEHASQAALNSLDTARQQGNDTQVQSNLGSLRAASQIYSSSQTPNSFGPAVTGASGCTAAGSMFADSGSGMARGVDMSNYPSGTQLVCNVSANGSSFAVQANLPSGGYWCVDSALHSKAESATLGVRTTCQ